MRFLIFKTYWSILIFYHQKCLNFSVFIFDYGDLRILSYN
ncbi:hypothetical protein ABOONEI_1911 [Aciduliprofundum boonei T469]|nr:hypothetical protein ABOONEI_874 [Aciduliprofundum boonei T469]EDY36990.1 hypothetical protein ABOONEI_1911 [Aciduliprofundum boonei T469]